MKSLLLAAIAFGVALLPTPAAPPPDRAQIDAKQAGAVGDGLANDTAALQRALDGGRRTVRIPAGTYKITAALQVDSETTITADPRATIRLADHAGTGVDLFLLTNRDHTR